MKHALYCGIGAICFLFLPKTVLGQIVPLNSQYGKDRGVFVVAYWDSLSLEDPLGLLSGDFRVRQGILELLSDEGWGNLDNKFLPSGVKGDWEGFTFFGAPMLGRKKSVIEQLLISDKKYHGNIIAVSREKIYELGCEDVSAQGNFVQKVGIFERGPKDEKNNFLSSFNVDVAPLPFRMATAFFLNESIMVIVAETNHPNINFLVFYDVAQRRPLGLKAFSTIKYLPLSDKLMLGEPMSKSVGTTQVDIKVVAFDILKDAGLNPALSSLESFK